MVFATKERITASRFFSTRRYILSTYPTLYISGRRDFQGTNQFLSDDAYSYLCTRTGALWTLQGYKFDGTDDYLSAPDSASLRFGTGNFTIALWVKSTFTGDSVMISKGNHLNIGKWAFFSAEGGYLRFTANSKWNNPCPTSIADGNWHLVTTQRLGNNLLTYIDARLDLEVVNYFTVEDFVDNDSVIWANVAALNFTWWPGTIGETLFYKRALTLIEIQQVYLATKWRY